MGNHIILSSNDNKSERIALHAVKVILHETIRNSTIFGATQRCNIVATLFRIVIMFQHCSVVLHKKIVVANRPV